MCTSSPYNAVKSSVCMLYIGGEFVVVVVVLFLVVVWGSDGWGSVDDGVREWCWWWC